MLYAFRRSANISLFLVLSVFMFEHQKDTVNCVASGKEQCITVKDVYEMSQTKNKQYRWKHAFQCMFFTKIPIEVIVLFLAFVPILKG